MNSLHSRILRKVASSLSQREQDEAEFKPIYTPHASKVFALAEREALRLNRDSIETELVLLGLVKFGSGVAANVLRRMGLDLKQVGSQLEAQMTAGGEMKMLHPTELTAGVKKVLVRAQREARSFNHTYVGTEHILLGLLSTDGGIAARILEGFGVSASEARRQILKELDPNEN